MPSISYEIYRCFTGQVFYSINHELLRYKRRTPVKSFLFHGVNHKPLVANEGEEGTAPTVSTIPHIQKHSRILHLSLFIRPISVIRVLIICPFRHIIKTLSIVKDRSRSVSTKHHFHSSLFTLHSSLFTVHLFTVHCSLFTLHSSLLVLSS